MFLNLWNLLRLKKWEAFQKDKIDNCFIHKVLLSYFRGGSQSIFIEWNMEKRRYQRLCWHFSPAWKAAAGQERPCSTATPFISRLDLGGKGFIAPDLPILCTSIESLFFFLFLLSPSLGKVTLLLVEFRFRVTIQIVSNLHCNALVLLSFLRKKILRDEIWV